MSDTERFEAAREARRTAPNRLGPARRYEQLTRYLGAAHYPARHGARPAEEPGRPAEPVKKAGGSS